MPTVASEGPQAADRPTLERLEPKAVAVTDADGKSFVCFTSEDGKEVARIFTDYHTVWAYMISLEAELLTYDREIELLNDNADRWEGLYLEADERGNTWKTSFESTHNLLLESEKARYERDRWGWVPWSIAALVAVAAGVVVVAQ